MLSKVLTVSLWGLDAEVVTVETDLQNGLPAINLVGLADTTIKEAKERIRPAILNTGYNFPRKRLTVNLSPAGRPKEGSHFDLPIAIGILSLGKEEAAPTKDIAYIGELSLDGRVKHIRGALPMAIGLREQGIGKLVLPQQNIEEVAILSDMELYPVKTLCEAMEYTKNSPYRRKKKVINGISRRSDDFRDVVGQENVKRALTVAAAGNHGILLMGSPGSGKTMMAKCIPTIMPKMTYEERMEVTKIHSVSGFLTEKNPAIEDRPFRAPHHTISKIALIGGGRKPRPGEISLAHNGILFLDEFAEFDGKLLEFLRQPIEEEKIIISRAKGTVTFPSKTMVVAAANPCKCGYLGDDTHVCTCSDKQIASYFSRFSGPLIDRIDLHVKVFPVPYRQMHQYRDNLSSAEMEKQVQWAAQMQKERYAGTEILFNSRLAPQQIRKYCVLKKEEEDLLKEAYEKLGLNMRTYYKIIKVARTIADLHQSDTIDAYHVAEALQYRSLSQLYRRV